MTDPFEDRLRAALRAQAETVSSPADAWEQFSAAPTTAPPARRRLAWLAVPSGIAAAAAIVVVALAVASGGPRKSGPALPPPTSPAPVSVAASTTTTLAPTTTVSPGPPGGPVPAGFTAASVTFVSAGDGWVLGNAPCGAPPCTSIVRTTDGGRTWKGIPAPSSANVTTLRFADVHDGWAYGRQELWSTHDGGASWHQVPLAGAPDTEVEDVEASAGVVRAAFLERPPNVTLWSSPVSTDAWQQDAVGPEVGAGPVPTGQLVLHGTSGWFVQDDRTVIGGSRLVGGTWVNWTPPCSTAGGPALLAAASATELVAACDQGVWANGPPVEVLYASHDGGGTWPDSLKIPLAEAGFVSAPAPGHTVVAGNDHNGNPTIVSQNGNAWTTDVAETGGQSWDDMGFTTASQGFAVGSGKMLVTRDGGATWAPIAF